MGFWVGQPDFGDEQLGCCDQGQMSVEAVVGAAFEVI